MAYQGSRIDDLHVRMPYAGSLMGGLHVMKGSPGFPTVVGIDCVFPQRSGTGCADGFVAKQSPTTNTEL